MNWNKSPLAFNDVRDAFERALSSPNGIRITFESHARAVGERSRFNYYRKLHRLENKATSEPGHIMHGHSIYDTLILRIPAKTAHDSNILYIEHRSVEDFNIEEL